MRISDWSSDVCSSDLPAAVFVRAYDRRHLLRLGSLFLAGTVREVFESAICMGTKAIKILGVSDGEIMDIERRFLENDHQRLDVHGAAGILGAAKALILDWQSPRLNSSHYCALRMPSSACTQI